MGHVKEKCEKCGREYDKRGIGLHRLKCQGQGKVDGASASTNSVVSPHNAAPQPSNVLKEINLKPEFDKNMATIQPKNKTPAEEENECGSCGGKFKGTPKFCPNCGVELEV